jgi:hypothetical protein
LADCGWSSRCCTGWYREVKPHLPAEADSVDLTRAERFLDALTKALRPDADEEEFKAWMSAELAEL